MESLLRTEGFGNDQLDEKHYEKSYFKLAHELGLDLPQFYFAILPHYYPDTLFKIMPKHIQSNHISMVKHYNDWEKVSTFLNSAYALQNKIRFSASKDNSNVLFDLDLLINKTEPAELRERVNTLKEKYLSESGIYTNELTRILEEASALVEVKKSLFAAPKLLWFGSENQFHQWLGNFFTGNLGRSVVDGRSVWSKLTNAFYWTISLILISIFLALIISVPLGLWSAQNSGSKLESGIANLFYAFYAIPIFWFATLMVVFFTTSEYGSLTNIFPNVGIKPGAADSVLEKILDNSKQLILPIFCMVLHSIAFLSRLVRSSLQHESSQLYKLTAQAKGFSLQKTYIKHLFPNALIPLITIVVGIIPASLAGSLVIEVIFNIPGIGRLMYDSIFNNDWYVIFSIVMFIGFATMLFYMIGDVLYSYVNPKIRVGGANKQ